MTQDQLDQESVTQLHDVVVELSKNCFGLKKLCATVLGASITLIAGFTLQRIDLAFFIGGAVVIAFFWIADAQSYYYQEKIRIHMKALQQAMMQRSGTNILVDGVGMPLSRDRENSPKLKRIVHSIFNASMTFYYGLLIIDAVMFWVYHLGFLHSKA
jgi:hypothetical protein